MGRGELERDREEKDSREELHVKEKQVASSLRLPSSP